MTRHPVVLAGCAKGYVMGQISSTDATLAGARAGLAGLVSPEVMEEVIATLQREQARLVRLRRAVDLVDQALREVRFVPRL